MKTLALLLSLALCGCASTAGARRELQAAIDASIDADRRHDAAARLALLAPDFELLTLDGRILRRADAERGIAELHRSTIAFGAGTRTIIQRISVTGDVATLLTNQHLVRTVRGPSGAPAERISNIRHRETWLRTQAGWKTQRVEELEQGPVTLDGEPVPFDAAGTAFVRTIRTQGVAAAVAAFDAARRRDPNAVLFRERTLNAAGYALLGEGRRADALELFKLNVRAYPESPNVYDSLAEAYAGSGDETTAARWYREALRRSPADDRIRAALQKLGAPVSDDELAAMLRDWLPADVELRPNVVYATHGRPLRMHVLLPRNAAPARPAILFIHGGGWTDGTRDRGVPSLIHFVQKGYVTASIEYRLSGEAIFPAQIDDVRAAIEYLRAHARDFGVDPHRIAVWGQSAGGHLAALAGTSVVGDARPDLVIDWNGPTDFLEPRELARLEQRKRDQRQPTFAMERLLGGPVTDRRDLAVAANPIHWVTPDDPPFLILHGSGDNEVSMSQSEMLRDALVKAGVEVRFEVFPGEGHFGIGPLPFPDKYYAPMDAFLEKHFGGR
ncbi:MAG TPA: alpha/beta hydrolase fold domain-containing protein [Thermoanaerobaculia bacterium]|nr:alpha/beta hydrolase fold domain-containing protein [Thermoanaerobaculia bacterium]